MSVAQRLQIFAAANLVTDDLEKLGYSVTPGNPIRINANPIYGNLVKHGNKYDVELHLQDRKVHYTISCKGKGGAQPAKTWDELRPIFRNIKKHLDDIGALIDIFEKLSFNGWTWNVTGVDNNYIRGRRKIND